MARVMSKVRCSLCVGLALLVQGCGAAAPIKDASAPEEPVAGNPPVTLALGGKDQVTAEGRPLSGPRKIKYTGRVTLVADDFGATKRQLEKLIRDVEAQGGHLSKEDYRAAAGSPRRGTWMVRVPVDGFRPFMDAVATLGELQNSDTQAEDVTDEYFDVIEHLKTARATKDRLQEHLKSSANTEQTLKIEQELARVDGEINRVEGKLRLLTDLVTLSTVHITVYERRGYVPQTEPEYATVLSRTWHRSLDTLVEFGKGVLVVIVALIPWLPIIGFVVLPIWILLRRRSKKLARVRARSASA